MSPDLKDDRPTPSAACGSGMHDPERAMSPLQELYSCTDDDDPNALNSGTRRQLLQKLGLRAFRAADGDQTGAMSFREFAAAVEGLSEHTRTQTHAICAALADLREGWGLSAEAGGRVFRWLSEDGQTVPWEALRRFAWPTLRVPLHRQMLLESGALSEAQLLQVLATDCPPPPPAAAARKGSVPRLPVADGRTRGLQMLFSWVTGGDDVRLDSRARAKLGHRLGLTTLNWVNTGHDGCMGFAEFHEMLRHMPPDATEDILAAATILAAPESANPAEAQGQQALHKLFRIFSANQPTLSAARFAEFAERVQLPVAYGLPGGADWGFDDFVQVRAPSGPASVASTGDSTVGLQYPA